MDLRAYEGGAQSLEIYRRGARAPGAPSVPTPLLRSAVTRMQARSSPQAVLLILGVILREFRGSKGTLREYHSTVDPFRNSMCESDILSCVRQNFLGDTVVPHI